MRPKTFPVSLLCLALAILLAGCAGKGAEPVDGTAPASAALFTGRPTGGASDAPETPVITEIPTPEPTPVPTAEPDIFIENPEVLAGLLADPGDGKALTLALRGDIEIEGDLAVKRCFILRLEGHSLKVGGDIVVDDEREGQIVFENGTVSANGLRAQAPLTGLDLRGCEAGFAEQPALDGFYVILDSLNGTQATDRFVHVRSFEELAVLTDPERMPCAREGQTVSIDLGIGEGDEIPYIDAPYTDLIWQAEGAPDENFAALYMNVRSYNGVQMAEYGLGGTGSGKLLSLDFRSGSGIAGEFPWEIKGNTVTLRMPLHYSEDYMKYARLDFELTSGTAAPNPEAVNGDGSIYLTRFHSLTVTDEEGRTRVYSVDISRRYGNIPVIYIETSGGAEIESKEEYLDCRVAVMNTASSGFATVPYTDARIRGRGNSTWKWDKKPYRIKFSSGVSLFGLHKAKDWVLLANYADKSLIRNSVAFDMARGLSFDFVPHQYPVDVYVNGEYQGVYGIGEQIERNQERVDIDLNYDDPDTGYLLEVCGSDEGDVNGVDFFHAGKLIFVTIKSPDTKKMSKEHFKFISDYVRAADRAVQALGDYYEYVDAESLYDWIIMCELTCNIDTAFRRSCFITKDKGGKLKFGPLWDFDLAMGNFSRDGGDYESWAATGREYVGDTWFTFLLNDPKFTEPFKARWFEVRDGILERAMEAIDRYAALLDYSQQENFTRWPIWDVKAGYQPSSMKKVNTYEKQIQFLKDWLTARAEWLDGAIGGL
jgi:hypothetical protein